MQKTLKRICELQPSYSSSNTVEMDERGVLIREALVSDINSLAETLSKEMGSYGNSFFVEGSDGKGNKVALPWVRFCSKKMSPKPTEGFYVVIHFSTDGSGVNVVVGCSSSRFQGGSSVVLPTPELLARSVWARQIVVESRNTLEPFTDSNEFGGTTKLTKSFQHASALVQKIPYEKIEDNLFRQSLIEAAQMLRLIYDAQNEGRELSQADQDELDILDIARPSANARSGQGYGLNADERKAVETMAMELSENWLISNGYKVTNTAANKPYDFEATKDGELLYVEVKGTTSDMGNAILMTHSEVAHHQKFNGRTALMIVTGIRLKKDATNPKASGGHLEPIIGWDISEWDLKPTTFRVTRNT